MTPSQLNLCCAALKSNEIDISVFPRVHAEQGYLSADVYYLSRFTHFSYDNNKRWNQDTSTTNIKLVDQNESLAPSTNENDCFIELIAYILRKCGQKDWKVTNL